MEDAEKLLNQFKQDQGVAAMAQLTVMIAAHYCELTNQEVPEDIAGKLTVEYQRLLLIRSLWGDTSPSVEL